MEAVDQVGAKVFAHNGYRQPHILAAIVSGRSLRQPFGPWRRREVEDGPARHSD